MKEAICFLSTLPLMGELSHSNWDVGNCQYLLFLSTEVLIISFELVWILLERVVIALFRPLHRSRWENLHFCGLWVWRYVRVKCFLSFCTIYILTLNFKASLIYRFFSLSVTSSFGLVWTRCLFSVSFHTDQVERTTPSHFIIEVFARQKS